MAMGGRPWWCGDASAIENIGSNKNIQLGKTQFSLYSNTYLLYLAFIQIIVMDKYKKNLIILFCLYIVNIFPK